MPRERKRLGAKFFCVRCKKFLAKRFFQEDKKRKHGIKSFCKPCHKAYGKEYWQREIVKETHSSRARERTQMLRDKVFSILGSQCASCGFSDKRALQIDHVNGGGRKERRSMSNHKFVRKVLSSKVGEEYQILCANCNWIKRDYEYKDFRSNTVHAV